MCVVALVLFGLLRGPVQEDARKTDIFFGFQGFLREGAAEWGGEQLEPSVPRVRSVEVKPKQL